MGTLMRLIFDFNPYITCRETAMICRHVWRILLIDVVLALTVACYPQQALTSNDMQASLYNPVNTQQEPPPLAHFRQILIENLQQYVGVHCEDKAPGIGVGLVTDQGNLSFGLGQRDIGKHLGVDRDTLFGIGSVSKLFVGMVLAKAVVDGELEYTTLANDWLDKSLQIDRRITLGQLVTHRSGLPNFPGNLYARSNAPKNQFLLQVMPAKDYSKANLASCLRQNECLTITPPGSHYGYSNLGIGILSLALQNRYGYQNSDEMIGKIITKRLNMSRTTMNEPDFLNRYRGDLAQGYLYQEPFSELGRVPLSDMGILAGSGELISTVSDINRFLELLTGLQGGVLQSVVNEMNRPLEATSQDEVKIGYAHQINRTPDGSYIHWKGGGTVGFTAIILWQTEPKVGLVILSNRGELEVLKAAGKRLIRLIARQL
jgi:CubicO group peptidase (beta-lactamase class C family)